MGEIQGFIAKPLEFKAIKPEKVIVDVEEREKISHHKPRGLRWSGVKATEKKILSRIIDIKKNYSYGPYLYTPRRVTAVLFYSESSGEVSMVPRADVALAICIPGYSCPSTPAFETRSEKRAVSYNPQRILGQFDFYQGAVWIMGDACFSSVWESESWVCW